MAAPPAHDAPSPAPGAPPPARRSPARAPPAERGAYPHPDSEPRPEARLSDAPHTPPPRSPVPGPASARRLLPVPPPRASPVPAPPSVRAVGASGRNAGAGALPGTRDRAAPPARDGVRWKGGQSPDSAPGSPSSPDARGPARSGALAAGLGGPRLTSGLQQLRGVGGLGIPPPSHVIQGSGLRPASLAVPDAPGTLGGGAARRPEGEVLACRLRSPSGLAFPRQEPKRPLCKGAGRRIFERTQLGHTYTFKTKTAFSCSSFVPCVLRGKQIGTKGTHI